MTESNNDIQDNMHDCLFCKIANGEQDAHVVYEDENFMAFLDIFPAARGHTLLVPKWHERWVHDVEPFGEYWETARTVMRQLEIALEPQWIQYFTHGAINHAHIHILPRYDDVEKAQTLPPQQKTREQSEKLKEIAEVIRSA